MPHLDVKDTLALALSSVQLLIIISTTMVKSAHMSYTYSYRQDVVDMLSRTLRRGLAAGQEARVAAALASQAAEGVDVRIRRVAVQAIGHVLNTRYVFLELWVSRGGYRPGGYAAVRESAESSARNAMIACVGDMHVVAAHMAAERDGRVREYMALWYPD